MALQLFKATTSGGPGATVVLALVLDNDLSELRKDPTEMIENVSQ